METHIASQTTEDKCCVYSLSSSSSSYSSSISSGSCSSSSASVVPLPCCSTKARPLGSIIQNDDDEEIQELRFINVVGKNGMEWKDVKGKFCKLASTSNGPEHVLKWSDFAFCIGMTQSPDFANELLRTLRGRKVDLRNDITENELHTYWCRLTDPSLDSRIRVFFDLCDKDMDGRITELDIKQTILLSASTNKLSITHGQAEEYAALIMDVLDEENKEYIELSQLDRLLRVGLSKNYSATSQALPVRVIDYYDDPDQETKSKAEIFFRSYWRRGWIILAWLILCIVLFAWKFIQYQNRKAFEVMGYCLSTAKGAAETLKLNMALILLPVCRNSLTWLRTKRHLSYVIPFNDNINFHKLIASGIVIGVILHGGTHLACDFPRISSSDRSVFQRTIAPNFGYHQPSYIQILATTEGATGISMVLLMAVAFVLATKWPRRQSPVLPRSVRNVTGYNTFWYSHHLFIFVYILLIVHSMFLILTDRWIEKTTWMYLAFPILLYATERTIRSIRSGSYNVKVTKASLYPGKVMSIKIHKPEGFEYKSGMYMFIQCPQISPFEWHPFSLTSGPQDDYLSVHIRSLGDWSYKLYSLFQEANLSQEKEYPKLHIDGPYGAATQDHTKYDIVILIGLGIGATPFISVLKDIVNGIQEAGTEGCNIKNGPAKAYLYWITRDQSSFDWFRDIIVDTSKINQKRSMVEMHNFLTSIYQEGDARSALISAVQALHHAESGIDIVSGTPVHTHFARPNWFSIFSGLARRHRGTQIGVFYCGPSALAKELTELCTKYSTRTATRFVFHKENY